MVEYETDSGNSFAQSGLSTEPTVVGYETDSGNSFALSGLSTEPTVGASVGVLFKTISDGTFMCLLPPPVQKFAGFQTSAVRSGSSWRTSPDPKKSWKRLHISEGKKSRSRKVKQVAFLPCSFS